MRAVALGVTAALTCWLAAATAGALAAGEIRSQARQLAGPAGDTAADLRRVEQLGPLVVAFIELSDEAARNGTEAQRRDELRGAFDAVYAALDPIYQARSRRLEAMARTVMDQDGDLEALYETAEFRDAQRVAAAALYYLNWLDYYGARLYDGARRKELLEAAETGFSQFAVGDQKSELITESQLGRGLAALELGDADSALRDFKLVIDDPNVSAERKEKARLATLDAYVRAGRLPDVLRYSDELLRGGSLSAADAPVVRFYRLQALFDAAEKSKGADAARYRQEAAASMDQLRRAGKGWADKVDAMMVARIGNPAEWAGKAQSPRVKWELARMMLAKNDAEGATPLLIELTASTDPEVKPFQPEAHYWLAVTRFKANDYAAAADEFDAALAAPGEWAKDARYLRFKALEAMMARAQPATAELSERYVRAITDLLTESADHPMAYEAHYRLAEYRQSVGEFHDAIDEYGRVTGDPGFELRARFGIVQCRFEMLRADTDPKSRQLQLEAIGQDLDRFWAQDKALTAKQKGAGDPALDELAAKATLLEAVYLSLRGGADERAAALLADFGQRFPHNADLLPQAIRLRLNALLQLERFADATRVVQQNATVLANEQRPDALEGLAAGYAKAAARRKAQGDAAGAEAASRAALALYQIADSTGVSADAKQRLTVARLHENAGEWDAAAEAYQQILRDDAGSVVALRGLAHAEEQQGKAADALGHWVAYTERAHPGEPGWYQGQYQQARLLCASGDKARCCELLTRLRPAMPGLTDSDLRGDLNALYKQACG
jgi:hypothetical protein